jgi:long-chain fatty acid transport protein
LSINKYNEETSMKMKNALRATVVASVLAAAGQVWATNGMLMEGYGPIGLSMGGAAQAYDNGTAGMMNNPATLQLGENGSRADIALGVLGPNVTAMGVKSGGTSYVMPAFGWVRKNDQYSYGVGVFGQGGMGTEYPASSPFGAGTGDARSELGVGRVIFPVSVKVNDRINVGATLDYTWASLDMKLLASPDQFVGMFAYGNGMDAAAAATALNGMGMGTLSSNFARLDFSNSNKFTGQAKGSGWTGKLGLTFKATETLTLGASYQLKTRLSDLATNAGGATFTLYPPVTIGPMTMPNTANGMAMPGRIIIKDFQMPSVLAVGVSFQASPQLQLAADLKKIGWSSVMKSFNMSFDMGGGQVMNFGMPQNWKDQTVLSLGGAYRLNNELTLRAGYSHSTNPIPDAYAHPLFPAIVKNHYTAGLGYQINKSMSLNAAVSHAPKVSVNSGMLQGMPSQAITHSQTNYQLMLSMRY